MVSDKNKIWANAFTGIKVTMIDNYDSFTYNLVQYLQELGASVTTIRNDQISVAQAMSLACDAFVISPGPSNPDNAGICLELVSACAAKAKPLFGVCLGHQCIGQAFGGNVVKSPLPMHGKVSQISHNQTNAFKGLENPLGATRYHSLIVDAATLPKTLQVTAKCGDEIMGLKHRDLPIEGVQFHPESVLTPLGHQILANFFEENLSH